MYSFLFFRVIKLFKILALRRNRPRLHFTCIVPHIRSLFPQDGSFIVTWVWRHELHFHITCFPHTWSRCTHCTACDCFCKGSWNEQRGVKEERQNHSKSGNEFNVENEFNKHRKCVITDTWIVSFGIGSESWRVMTTRVRCCSVSVHLINADTVWTHRVLQVINGIKIFNNKINKTFIIIIIIKWSIMPESCLQDRN